MQKTLIAWTDHTFNPWMGCTKVSAGCKNCYAERLTRDRMGLKLWGPRGGRQITKAPWQNVRKWNRKAKEAGEIRRVFCGSLCDVFEDHPTVNEVRPRLWQVIRESTWLDFQMLTKRPENGPGMLPADWGDGYPNVWIGCTIEDNRVAHRGDALRTIPAQTRFVSYEPAIGPLDQLDLTGIHWVIYGGESGPDRRKEDKQWARDMRDRCRALGVAFFHKQSAHFFTERGIELDGELIREFPRHSGSARLPVPSGAPIA